MTPRSRLEAGRDWPFLVAVGAPGVILAVLFGALGVTRLADDQSSALAPAVTSLAEAAGNRDAAEVVWRLSSGASVTEASPVRIPLKIEGVAHLSPLEAAVVSEWTPMMQLLVDAGALRDAATLLRIRCMAQRERDRDTIVFLASLDENRPIECQGVEMPAYLRASLR